MAYYDDIDFFINDVSEVQLSFSSFIMQGKQNQDHCTESEFPGNNASNADSQRSIALSVS